MLLPSFHFTIKDNDEFENKNTLPLHFFQYALKVLFEYSRGANILRLPHLCGHAGLGRRYQIFRKVWLLLNYLYVKDKVLFGVRSTAQGIT